MAVEYDSRRPIDPFQKTNPLIYVVIAVIVVLLIIVVARYVSKHQEEQQAVSEEVQAELPQEQPAQEPVQQPPQPVEEEQKPLTPADLQNPDFSSQDTELPNVV